MGSLEGKVVLVTGAAGGIGKAEAKLFAEEGAKLVLADISPEVDAVAAAIGGGAVAARLDVGDADSWAAATALAVSAHGGLDVLVNSAGVFAPGPIAEMAADAFMDIVRINQLGTFLGMQAAARAMKPGGVIVNTASVAGLFGVAGGAAYAASKWAVRGLGRSAAIELGKAGIRVNTIVPGGIDTPMLAGQQPPGVAYEQVFAAYPIARVGQPEEIARAALFLASDASSYMTGGEIVVDGGLHAGPLFG